MCKFPIRFMKSVFPKNMYISFSMFAIFICVTQKVYSQNYIGFVAGLNQSSQTGSFVNGNVEFSSIGNFVIGGVIGTAINENLDVQIEPLFLRKGAKQKGNQQRFGAFDSQYSAYYAEIAAFLKYNFNTSKVRPYFLAGFGIGLRFDAEYDFHSDNYSSTFEANNLAEIFDLNYNIGSGINFNMDKFSIFIEGRYSIGVLDTFHGGQGYFGDAVELVRFDDFEIKNKGIILLAGITIPFKRTYKS